MGKLRAVVPLAAVLLTLACHASSGRVRVAFSERETKLAAPPQPVHYADDMTDIDAATGDDAAWRKSYEFRPTRRRPAPASATMLLPDSEDDSGMAAGTTTSAADTQSAAAEAIPQQSDTAVPEGQD